MRVKNNKDHSRADLSSVWCSNDCLGGPSSQGHRGDEAAIDRRGAGAVGTRSISGTNHINVLPKHEPAALHGKESAPLFPSGYVSN